MSRRMLLLLCCIALVLAACAGPGRFDNRQRGLRGSLLIWHNWQQPNTAVLENLFADFMTIHPGVQIISEYIPDAEFVERLGERSAIGLGPDLIIGLNIHQLHALHGQTLIAPIARSALAEQALLPHALNALQVGEHLYGVPFTAYTEILYYNKTLVERPAQTFDDLIQEARSGKQVALPTDFRHAYWGIRTFGNDILDEEGRLQMESGLESWVTWLLEAQAENLILSPNYGELKQLFAAGHAAYFVGNSVALSEFRAILGEEVVGVTLLPHPPMDEELDSAKNPLENRFHGAGGFLDLEIMAISKVSAEKQVSFELIKFFTNRTHQRELAQYDLGQIPINQSVRFDPRFSPTQAALIRQSVDSAILSLQEVELENALLVVGTDLYSQILEGVLTPQESSQVLLDNLQLHLQQE